MTKPLVGVTPAGGAVGFNQVLQEAARKPRVRNTGSTKQQQTHAAVTEVELVVVLVVVVVVLVEVK